MLIFETTKNGVVRRNLKSMAAVKSLISSLPDNKSNANVLCRSVNWNQIYKVSVDFSDTERQFWTCLSYITIIVPLNVFPPYRCPRFPANANAREKKERKGKATLQEQRRRFVDDIWRIQHVRIHEEHMIDARAWLMSKMIVDPMYTWKVNCLQ